MNSQNSRIRKADHYEDGRYWVSIIQKKTPVQIITLHNVQNHPKQSHNEKLNPIG